MSNDYSAHHKEELERRIVELKTKEIKTVLNRVSLFLGVPLYLSYWILDIIYVPEYMWEFLALRLTIIPATLCCYYLVNHFELDYTQLQYVGFGYAVVAAAIIHVIIYTIGTPNTVFYAALNLVGMAAFIFIPFSLRFYILTASVIYLPYLYISFVYPDIANIYPTIIGHWFFIIGTIIIGWVGRAFNEQHRQNLVLKMMDLEYESARAISAERKASNARADAIAAEQANKSKSNFLAHVSHELRTPLQGILGYNDLMLDANASKDYRQINDNAQRVKTASTHLCNIVEGLLDFASIEADKVQFNETVFNVNSLVNEVTSTLQPLFANNQNNFTSNIASDVGYISSDYMKLKQILINLLSNANKFTRNGNVRLDISVNTLNSKSCLKIIVSDTGIGINQANLDKVFDAFVQISYGQKKQYQGTGLGLAIVKQFTKLLGGEVYVSSEENKGATFCLTIPYHPRNERDLQSSTPEPGALFTRKLSVLLADDDEMLRVLFTRFLENSGHKVETFAKGKEALHQLRQHRYDAVILDLHMPDMTGLEIIRDLDGSPNANTPIFILTADATRDIRDQTLELGATILHKPISQEQLLNRLYMVIAGDSNGSMNPTPAHRTAYGTNELLDTGMLSVLQPNDKDGTFTTNLIKIYIAQSQSLIEQFKAALSQGDLDTVWQRLHKLDGSSSSMGAFAMAKTVQHISQRVRDNKYELNTLFDEIDSVFLATCEALRTL